MEEHQKLDSMAEKRAQECLTYSFCSSLKLQLIKDMLAKMLNHIGDNGMFAEYTMHDISHVNGMLALLNKIIPDDTQYKMTHADWLMTVLAIYFHDLGMLIPQDEYESRDTDTDYKTTKEAMLKKPDVKSYVESLKGDAGEKFLYQEYVRRNHGKRISEWITNCNSHTEEPYKMIADMLGSLDTSFRSDLAMICASHQMDELPDHLKSVDEAYGSSENEKVNLLYVSVLLRSADILHMTHDRTPEIEYRIISPKNEISIVEWAKQRAVRSVDIHLEKDENGHVDRTISPHSFEIQARFNDDKGYFSFKSFLDEWAIPELKRCHEWCEGSRTVYSTDYKFPWTDIDTSRIQAEGFSKSKLRFEIDQQNILRLLTGHTLYNDSTVVLRELVQNAMDAGRLKDSMSKSKSSYQCKIEISWNSSSRILRIADNATGMDTASISNYLLKVGASKYQSEEFKNNYPDFHSISRFGIGLLTCFMISDDVDIYTLDESEGQCHLLKIRNLNGEYLMRNDADTSNILGGHHGTTFELTVRPGIDMSDIETQLRQWIIIPFGEVTLTVDGATPSIIGYTSVKEAVERYASKLNGVDLSGGKYQVAIRQKDGMEIAFLQRLDPTMKVWNLYTYREEDVVVDAPLGICVEGVRVTSDSPGADSRHYLVLADCRGKQAPTTNVARNDLEGGAALDRMYRAIYESYIDLFVSQIPTLQSTYSVTWAVTEISYMINQFNSERFYRQFTRREILNDVLRNAKCNAIDDGSKLKLESVSGLPDKICTLESMAFSSAVSLLKDMSHTGKTAFGLLSELEKSDVSGEKVLLTDSMAYSIYSIFLDTYEVTDILADESVRKIKFTWSRKAGIWKQVRVEHHHGVSINLYVLLDKDKVSVEGADGKNTIVSGRNVFLINDSPLLSFMRRILVDDPSSDDACAIVSDLVCQLLTQRQTNEEQIIDRYVNSDDNYLKKALFEKFTPEELKAALKGITDSVLNIKKYYR